MPFTAIRRVVVLSNGREVRLSQNDEGVALAGDLEVKSHARARVPAGPEPGDAVPPV